MAQRVAPDIVFLDVHLPDGNGLEAIKPLREVASRPEVIVITGLVDAEGAETAIQAGVWDYVEKSSSAVQLALSIKRALRFREASSSGVIGLRRVAIVGEGPRISEALAKAAQSVSSGLPVLITGESGTGKELFARCIHDNSRRAGREFVIIDCAALPETLVESILFGHARGAFTGADMTREGLVKAADGGTLFLDEVGELPLSVQKTFLRVLQERRFRPVGARTEVQSDFRLVAATNRDLQRMVAEGRFREDLYFRLQAFEIVLPPLRERHKDLSLLVGFCLKRLATKSGDRVLEASPEFMEELRRYPWPGNVRELFQALEKAAAKAGDEQILFPEHLPQAVRVAAMQSKISRACRFTANSASRLLPRPRNAIFVPCSRPPGAASSAPARSPACPGRGSTALPRLTASAPVGAISLVPAPVPSAGTTVPRRWTSANNFLYPRT